MKSTVLDKSYQDFNCYSETKEARQRDIDSAITHLQLHQTYPKSKDAKVLDIGCAMGRFMLALKSLGYNNVFGVDSDEKLIKFASEDNLDVKAQDILEFLKNDKNIYDVIYCINVLQYVDKDKQLELLTLTDNHLSKEGFLVLQVPNAMSPLAGSFGYSDFSCNTLYTTKSIEFLCNNAGMNYSVCRPEHFESDYIQSLKKTFADLYKLQFGIANPILTPNFVAVVFKSENVKAEYLKIAPEINILYDKIQANPELDKFKNDLTNQIADIVQKLVDQLTALRNDLDDKKRTIDRLIDEQNVIKEILSNKQ